MPPFYITDKRNRRYEVLCEFYKPNLFYDVMDGKLRVGSLRCYFDDPVTLRILEIVMYNERNLPRRYWWNLWRLGDFGRKWNYRRKGLGTGLKNLMLGHARDCGFERVIATVVPFSGSQGEWLLAWYRRLGFTILSPDKAKNPSSIAEIEMVLCVLPGSDSISSR